MERQLPIGADQGCNCTFIFKLHAVDKGLLLKVRDTFDCGNVYFQKEKRRNHTQCYRYTVSAQRDIFSKIIPFFRKHKLQAVSKRRSFDLFCRIADMVKAKKHLMSNGSESIRVLKKQMNQRTVGLA